MTAPISRKQAYARLLIAMIDLQLPAPKGIELDGAGPLLAFDTAEQFEAWRTAIDARASKPFVGSTGIASYTAQATWRDMDIVLSAMIHPSPESGPVTDDLTSVREIAEHGEDEPRCPDPECGEPLALIASGAVGHCGRTCAPLDEKTAQVEEDAAERRSVEREQRAEVEAEQTEVWCGCLCTQLFNGEERCEACVQALAALDAGGWTAAAAAMAAGNAGAATE